MEVAMNTNGFIDWLVTEKEMSIRSAKDVLSRYGRVSRMVGSAEICAETFSFLRNCEQFEHSSMFIKSQLKRALSLYLEYKERFEKE